MRRAIDNIFFCVLSSGVSSGSFHGPYLVDVLLLVAHPEMTGGAPFVCFLLWQYLFSFSFSISFGVRLRAMYILYVSVVYFVELCHDFLCVGADGLLLLP